MIPSKTHVIYTEPRIIDNERLSLFDKYYSFETQIVQPIHLKEVNVSSEYIFWRGWRILPESRDGMEGIPFYDSAINRIKFILFNLFRRKKKKISSSYWVADNHSANYYHWIVEILPKFNYLSESFESFNVVLPVSFSRYGYVVETLALIRGIHVIYFDDLKEYIHCQELSIVPNFQVKTFNTPVITAMIKNFIAAKFSLQLLKTQLIYLSRRDNTGRCIINESEIITFLEEKGFDIVFTEEMNFEDQVKLFSNAAILIGLHGAGLTNMVFMMKGSSVLEIRNTSDPNGCYFTLAKSADLDYYYYASETTAWAMSTMKVYVEIERFSKVVNAMLTKLQSNGTA